MTGYYASWVKDIKKQTLGFVNKLMTGNITVSQAHVERDELVEAFNDLADVLEGMNKERTEAQRDLILAQEKLRHN